MEVTRRPSAPTQLSAHFVVFYSPGTMTAENTTKPIACWDVDAAKVMARDITERHGATPYGFKFTTRARSDSDLDSKQVAVSPFYWLGGEIETLAEVEARAPGSILAQNMRCNHWDKVITNRNGYMWTQPLDDKDVVLEWTP